MRTWVAQGGLVCPVLLSLYGTDISTSSSHIELARYADDITLVATSQSPSLLVGYLDAYLGRLKRCLRDWMLAIYVSMRTAVPFVKAARNIQKPRPAQFLGVSIHWFDTAWYLVVTLDI
jgi:hypothetical protein